MEGQTPGSAASSDGLADASLVVGIVGIIGVFVPLGLFVSAVSGPLAIIFGIAALRRQGVSDTRRAYTGIGLGTAATSIAVGTFFILRHVLWNVITRFAA